MKRFSVLVLLLAVFFIFTCGFKPRGWWSEPQIGVMADSTDWLALQSTLRFAVEKPVRTPQLEKTFHLRWVRGNEFDRYSEFRYLILAGTLESEGEIGQLVGRVVSDPAVREQVESGDQNIFTLRNQWAKDQLMVILVAKDVFALREIIEGQGNFVYEVFDTDFNERLLDDMFMRARQEDLQERLMLNYGWTIKLQRDYFLVQEFPEDGFAWFRRMYPERWVFVRWIDGGDISFLSAEWVVGERNRIGAEYYSGDRVSEYYLNSREGTFLGRPAQITTGLWENVALTRGGPFKNYTFYDSLSRRIYMVDVAVHAPERDKQPLMRRMDIIARTFRTVFDMEE